uniref:Uncharacterized protein n=1 Tax=Entomoneis paludosa TaxID=265537 RepID=A0A7S2YLU2_9STRA|mmetsp:Transcript_38058/g.79125  ORF Transcript_38058/g.79125 Transcript_38058/m.79125 type:complete len:102 (+) Transcript_38058:1437-1742(+)
MKASFSFCEDGKAAADWTQSNQGNRGRAITTLSIRMSVSQVRQRCCQMFFTRPNAAAAELRTGHVVPQESTKGRLLLLHATESLLCPIQKLSELLPRVNYV